VELRGWSAVRHVRLRKPDGTGRNRMRRAAGTQRRNQRRRAKPFHSISMRRRSSGSSGRRMTGVGWKPERQRRAAKSSYGQKKESVARGRQPRHAGRRELVAHTKGSPSASASKDTAGEKPPRRREARGERVRAGGREWIAPPATAPQKGRGGQRAGVTVVTRGKREICSSSLPPGNAFSRIEAVTTATTVTNEGRRAGGRHGCHDCHGGAGEKR
jgi:hypothetical protein